MPETFLLGQPIWHLHVEDEAAEKLTAQQQHRLLWSLGVDENDPGEEATQVRKGAVIPHQFFDPDHHGAKATEVPAAAWRRLSSDEQCAENRSADRPRMLELAISDDPRWRRVALVCGAGYGKTTNLQWMLANLNRMHYGRAKQIAIFTALNTAASELKNLQSFVASQLTDWGFPDESKAKQTAIRLLDQGRVTFLLDSLDQAAAEQAIAAIRTIENQAKRCRIWVSGRPYAFRDCQRPLQEIAKWWQFLRIGPLDEPECRQLLETTSRSG